jgi:hypothetical protein
MKLLFSVTDRLYSSYTFTNIETGEPVLFPLSIPLFHGDIIEVLDESYPTCLSVQTNDAGSNTHRYKKTILTSIRNESNIPGVLILEDGKTYGRTENQKRLLYKCVPDNPKLPIFLVPYDIKASFLKKNKNKYILFHYQQWEGKHPQGVITETLGNVDELSSFYEYQMHAKYLVVSLSPLQKRLNQRFTECSLQQMITQIREQHSFQIHDAMGIDIFTIDPPNSVDFDDGWSISEDQEKQITTITIYIANVFLWIEYLQLWDVLSERVSTVYLPDKKKPLLPPILSEQLCSLKAGEPRFAFAMEWKVNSQTGESIAPCQYKQVMIKVKRNYQYEEKRLIENRQYQTLLNLSKKIDTTVPLDDSHDLVAFWMVKMNFVLGKYMVDHRLGIGRVTKIENKSQLEHGLLSTKTRQIIQSWKYNTKGYYIPLDHTPVSVIADNMTGNNRNTIFTENSLPYIHITSPIRRLVDIINQTLLIHHLGLVENLSPSCQKYMDKWQNQVSFINESMQNTKKVQYDCELMHRFYHCPHMVNTLYRGIVFGKTLKKEYLQYMVYCEDIKLLSFVIVDRELDEYGCYMFRFFLFENEDNKQKKIRMQWINE